MADSELGMGGSTICLQTRVGTNIENVQDAQLPQERVAAAAETFKRYVRGATICVNGPSGYYNCMGLVFASRRTQILNLALLRTMLLEDGYRQVPEDEARPGDVAVYTYDGNDEHVGIVVEAAPEKFARPRIWSKWGWSLEAVHYPLDCPYHEHEISFFRMQAYDIPKPS